jgi:hypothetical protein
MQKKKLPRYPEEEQGIQEDVWIGLGNDGARRMRWREVLQRMRISECIWPGRTVVHGPVQRGRCHCGFLDPWADADGLGSLGKCEGAKHSPLLRVVEDDPMTAEHDVPRWARGRCQPTSTRPRGWAMTAAPGRIFTPASLHFPGIRAWSPLKPTRPVRRVSTTMHCSSMRNAGCCALCRYNDNTDIVPPHL